MTLPLPLMNNLCKRWILPPLVKQECDLYYLRNYTDAELVSHIQSDDGEIYIMEYGVVFNVIFMYDTLRTYTRNGELTKLGQTPDTKYWCSFRSITFEFRGEKVTKSYVLVQVDKGKETKDLIGTGARMAKPDAAGRAQSSETFRNKVLKPALHGEKYGIGVERFVSFLEKSQPIEKDEEV